MKNYLFILSESKKEVKEIQQDNPFYIKYNNYLLTRYFTDIEDNEDFIPMDSGEEIIMVLDLPEDNDVEDEDVFEVMQDMLYMRA